MSSSVEGSISNSETFSGKWKIEVSLAVFCEVNFKLFWKINVNGSFENPLSSQNSMIALCCVLKCCFPISPNFQNFLLNFCLNL